jgi:outer membrane protein OmpA-like peptidoglycan-associated protein
MDSSRDILKTPGEQPPRGRGGWGKVILLLAIFAAILGVLVYFFFSSLNRVNRQAARLAQENAELQQRLAEVEKQSQAAAQQASQAAVSAQIAAQQRDQAEKAQVQSESAAQAAQQQASQAQQQAAAAEQKAEEYRQEREAELARLQQVLGQIADTRRTAMGLIMTLGSNSIRFDFDKSDIKPPYRETLSRIAGVLSTLRGYSIYVYGYTDDVGTQEYNLELSERRAQAVRDYLIKSGLDPKIISTKGLGKSDPRVPGNSAEARAKNRRVEIGIVDSTIHLAGQVPQTK